MNKYAQIYIEELKRITKTAYETGFSSLSHDGKNLILSAGNNKEPYSDKNQPWFNNGLEPELAAQAIHEEDFPGEYGSELSVPLDVAEKHKVLKGYILEAIKDHEKTKEQLQ